MFKTILFWKHNICHFFAPELYLELFFFDSALRQLYLALVYLTLSYLAHFCFVNANFFSILKLWHDVKTTYYSLYNQFSVWKSSKMFIIYRVCENIVRISVPFTNCHVILARTSFTAYSNKHTFRLFTLLQSISDYPTQNVALVV